MGELFSLLFLLGVGYFIKTLITGGSRSRHENHIIMIMNEASQVMRIFNVKGVPRSEQIHISGDTLGNKHLTQVPNIQICIMIVRGVELAVLIGAMG